MYTIYISYRDNSKDEETTVDSYSVVNGCLKLHTRFGVNAGTRFIPLDRIEEWKVI